MTARLKCSAKTPDMQGIPNVHPCARSATVQRDGKWYCWQHNPEHVKAQAIKRMTAWQAEQDRLGTVCARHTRNARLGALVTEELAELLVRLGHIAGTWGYHDAAEEAHTLAARIREVLGEH